MYLAKSYKKHSKGVGKKMQIQTTNQNLASCIEASIWTQKNVQKLQVCRILVFVSGGKILSIGSFHSFLGVKHYKQQFQMNVYIILNENYSQV